MSTTPQIGDLADVELFSGVNEDLEPFCQLRATGEIDGRQVSLIGQLPPETMRGLGRQYLEIAEAAEMDATVARFFVAALGMDMDAATLAVGHLRGFRATLDETDDEPPTEDSPG